MDGKEPSAYLAAIAALRNDDIGGMSEAMARGAGSASDLLRFACETGSPQMCRALIEGGASVGPINLHRRSALYLAANKGRLDICRVLVELGADPSLVTPLPKGVMLPVGENPRLSPFHVAVENGQLDVVRFFVTECGQDPAQRVGVFGKDKTMIQLAYKNPAMRELLRSLKTEMAVGMAVDSGAPVVEPEGVSAPMRDRRMAPI